ncbi:MAG: O-antigen ligase family protein [bacterium]|nr:O-antigen ligase family protein [bacterium]
MIFPIADIFAAQAGGNMSWLVITITLVAFAAAVFVALRPSQPAHFTTLRSAPAAVVDERLLRPEPAQMRWLETALLGLLLGYIMFDRPFAWIHVPGTPLFVGEMVIALGVWVVLSAQTGISALVRSSASLRFLRNFMLWGLVLLAIGILPYGQDAIRDSAIWYYGTIALLVAMLLVSDPRRVGRWLTRFAKILPIFLIWYPLATVLVHVGPQSIYIPDSKIPILFHRSGNMAVLAAIGIAFLWLADGDSKLFTPRQRAWLTTLATLVIVFTGLENRGGLVSAAVLVAGLLFLLSKRRVELVMAMIGVLVFFAAIGIVFDVRVELFGDRDISIDQFTKNITSIFNPDEGGQRQTETTAWRLKIWEQVLDDVSNDSPIMGFGMGPDLGERYEISTNEDAPLRNPHNSHVGVLARTGWLGAILWALMWITWMAELQTLRRRLRHRNRPRESAAVTWIMLTPIPILVNAIFDPTLEGAQVAMLLWAFFGAGAALVVLAQQNRFPSLTSIDSAGDTQSRVTAR